MRATWFAVDAEDLDRTTAERVARNNHAFRVANEGIGAAARALEADFPITFVCECADSRCTDLVRLTLPEYEEIRGNELRFIVVSGHERRAGPYEQVVEERRGYAIVQKVGEAAEIVKELDPNAGEPA
jgi:hypothetical protein